MEFKSKQYEFTPAGQENLSRWTDMMTLRRYIRVKDGQDLAAIANGVLERYKRYGAKALRTASVPRTKTRPAEHLIVVVFGQPSFLEAAFARFYIADGIGRSQIYSHRIYGQKVGNQMSAWLKAHGPSAEKAVMDFRSKVALTSLGKKPGKQPPAGGVQNAAPEE